MPAPRCWTCLILAAVTGAAGCTGNTGLHPVRGEVRYPDGTPFRGGTVVCQLINSEHRASANGAIDDQGSFQLGTYRESDGVLVGTYRAAVLPPALSEAESQRTPSPIDEKFTDPATANLTFEVTPGGNQVVLEVTRPAKGGRRS